MEKLLDRDFWLKLRKITRVHDCVGRGQCWDWCDDALWQPEVAANFVRQIAELGEIQIDQYATSILEHHWLKMKDADFIADGTAGQFENSLQTGYYGPLQEAPETLKAVYARVTDRTE